MSEHVRVTQAPVQVVHGDEVSSHRITQGVIQTVHGAETADHRITQGVVQVVIGSDNPRLLITQGVVQVVFENELVPSLPSPFISGEAITPRSILLTIFTPEEATSHNLHRGLAPGFDIDETTLIATFGPDPSSYLDEDLEPLTTYYYRLVAFDDEENESLSNEIGVITLAELTISSITVSSGLLGFFPYETGAEEIQYQTTLSADVNFDTPFDDVILIGDARFSHLISDRPDNTGHRSRARKRESSVSEWSSWSNVVVWTTLADLPPPQLTARFTYPEYGQPLRGTSALLAWVLDPGLSVIEVAIAPIIIDSWTVIPDHGPLSVTFDTTIFDDGFYRARLELSNGIFIYHPGFWIDNAFVVHYEDELTTIDFANYLTPSTTRYILGGSCVGGMTGHIGPTSGPSSFGPVNPISLTLHDRASVAVEMAPFVTGGGQSWNRTQGGEVLEMGVNIVARITGDNPNDVRDYIGIRCGVEHFLISQPVPGMPIDIYDSHRYIGIGTGTFHLSIGPGAFTFLIQGGWHHFSADMPVAVSWLQMLFAGITDGCRRRPYRLFLDIQRPDPTNFPNRYTIIARCEGPDAYSITGRQVTVIHETVDVAIPQFDGGSTPHVFECGHLAFHTHKLSGHQANTSGRFFRRFSATVDTDECGEPPEPPIIPPEEIEFEEVPGDEIEPPVVGLPCPIEIVSHVREDALVATFIGESCGPFVPVEREAAFTVPFDPCPPCP